MLRQLSDRRMFMGTCITQAIRTEAISIGFDIQLELVTQQADTDTGSYASSSDEAYSLLRRFWNDVG
ncbi:hypothetical protein CQ12_25335 [Bradyrhizobium jicamae]|uniref:Uncharacterized protein n=1 Tax=Bradyrhizobium jicamae TaxID=280332 RepID=A0A0R3LSP0_9BRAD|nr:hypothetical protein CQ12_25335 [Bradyrhizobium jicamae]